MEGRAVAVHEDHGGRKVERAGRQDPEAGPGEKRVARQQTSLIEVVSATWQDHDSEECQRCDPCQADYSDAALDKKNYF